MHHDKQEAIGALRTMPGVRGSIAADLWNIGIRKVTDLKGEDPGQLYALSTASPARRRIAACYMSSAVPFIMPARKACARKIEMVVLEGQRKRNSVNLI